ncbi:MAG: Crp/Fnr family transcriptional regulator [Sphingobacteriales bacterium]|nr:Crp/Fnr family transcriptional regulator [Sphingobacteriales bacterium]
MEDILFQCRNKVHCFECTNRENSLFTDISDEHKVRINDAKVHCEYKKGEMIFKEGNLPTGLICLNRGKVKIIKEGIGGREQIIRLARPIELIGYRALFAGERYNSSAVALEDSTVCHIDKEVVLDVISQDPMLGLRIVKRLAIELGEAKTRIVNLTQKHIRGRLAEALLILYNRFGTNPEDGTLDISLGRNDLADLSNMTASNASRTLSQFIDEKIIETQGKKIRILNLERLKWLSNYG